MSNVSNVRIEHDLLGDREVPDDAYYGVHTLRAKENFQITGTSSNNTDAKNAAMIAGVTLAKKGSRTNAMRAPGRARVLRLRAGYELK